MCYAKKPISTKWPLLWLLLLAVSLLLAVIPFYSAEAQIAHGGAHVLLEHPELKYKGIKNYSQPQGWGCVGCLRRSGYYVPRTQDGSAGSIVVDSTDLPPEGEYVVIVTWESGMGHVALATVIDGVIIVRYECNYGKGNRQGRIVPRHLYKGYIKSPTPPTSPEALSLSNPGLSLTESSSHAKPDSSQTPAFQTDQ